MVIMFLSLDFMAPPRQELSILAPASYRDQDGLHPQSTCSEETKTRVVFILFWEWGGLEGSWKGKPGLTPDPEGDQEGRVCPGRKCSAPRPLWRC